MSQQTKSKLHLVILFAKCFVLCMFCLFAYCSFLRSTLTQKRKGANNLNSVLEAVQSPISTTKNAHTLYIECEHLLRPTNII